LRPSARHGVIRSLSRCNGWNPRVAISWVTICARLSREQRYRATREQIASASAGTRVCTGPLIPLIDSDNYELVEWRERAIPGVPLYQLSIVPSYARVEIADASSRFARVIMIAFGYPKRASASASSDAQLALRTRTCVRRDSQSRSRDNASSALSLATPCIRAMDSTRLIRLMDSRRFQRHYKSELNTLIISVRRWVERNTRPPGFSTGGSSTRRFRLF